MPKQELSHAQDEDQEQRRQAPEGAPRGGSIKRSQAFKRHILTKKTTKNKRRGAERGCPFWGHTDRRDGRYGELSCQELNAV